MAEFNIEQFRRNATLTLSKIGLKTTSSVVGENLRAASEREQYIIYIKDENVDICDEDLATYIEDVLSVEVISIKHFNLKNSKDSEIWVFFEFA